MATIMTSTKKYFTNSFIEAESIVKKARELHGNSIKKHSISKRSKVTKEEFIEFYIVDITVENYTLRDLV